MKTKSTMKNLFLLVAITLSTVVKAQNFTEPLTVKTNVDAVLTFENTDNSWQYFQFKRSGERKTWMGLSSKNNFHINKEGGGNILLMGGNVGVGKSPSSGYALDVNGKINSSGISLAGSLSMETNDDAVLTFNNTDDSWQYFQFKRSGERKTWMGLSSKNNFHINKEGDGNILLMGGNVGIDTSNPLNKLSVNGSIWAKEVKVSFTDAADWVFEDDYELRTLEEVEKFVKENKHLPEIPSAEEFKEKNLNVAEMDNKLLQKVEELTLYLIEQNKQNKAQQLEIEELKRMNIELLKKIEELK